MHLLAKLTMSVVAAIGLCAVSQAQEFQYRQGGTVEGAFFLPSDPDLGWITHDGGKISRSTDRGQSWATKFVPDNVRGHIRGIHFLNEDDGWACGDNGFILATTNGGDTWSVINSSPVLNANTPARPAVLRDIFMTSSGTGYVVGDDGAYAKTDDNWTTFEQAGTSPCDGPSPYTSGTDGYDVHFFDESTGLVSMDYQRVYRTTDAGCSWQIINVLGSSPTHCPLTISSNIELWSMAWEDPDSDSSPGWVVGGDGTNRGYIFKSLDGGLSWSQTHCYLADLAGLEEDCAINTPYGVAVLGSGAEAVIGGYASSVLAYEPGTPNWNACDTPDDCYEDPDPPSCGSMVWSQYNNVAEFGKPALKRAAHITDDEACLVGVNGVIRRFLPNASPGNQIVDEGTLHFTRIADGDFSTSSTGCVITQGNIVKRTTNSGATWTDVYTPGVITSDNFGKALDFEGTKGVAIGSNGLLLYSTNSGASWSVASTPSHYFDFNAVDFAPSSDTIFGVTVLGRVYVSTDAGVNYDDVFTGSSETLNGVAFATTSTGFVVGNNATAYKTTTGGAAWTSVSFSGGTPGHLHDVATWGNGTNAVTVGVGGAVYVASGGAFVKQTIDLDPGAGVSTPTVDLHDVEVIVDGSDVHFRVVGVDGLVLFRDAAGTWTSPKSQSSDNLVRACFDAVDHGFILGTQFTVCEFD